MEEGLPGAPDTEGHTSSKPPQCQKKPGLRDINTENTMFYECLRCLFPELTTIINSFTAVSFIAFPVGHPPAVCLRILCNFQAQRGWPGSWHLSHRLLAAGRTQAGVRGCCALAWTPHPCVQGERLAPRGGDHQQAGVKQRFLGSRLSMLQVSLSNQRMK